MNNFFLTIIFMVNFMIAANAQNELFTEINRLNRVVDTLKGNLKNSEDISKVNIKKYQDSLNQYKINHSLVLNGLNEKINNKEKEIEELRGFKEKYEKSNSKKQEEEMKSLKGDLLICQQEKQDVLSNLRLKDIELKKLEATSKIKEEEKYNTGQQEAYKSLANFYQSKSLDLLISSSTSVSVARDIELLRKLPNVPNKIIDLEKYFKALIVLENKYNSQSVESAIRDLNTIKESSELVKKLSENINDYKLCTDNLIKALDNISLIDKAKKANSDETQKKKCGEVSFELAYYIRNYISNLSDFPHLSSIVIEALKKKNIDANTDLSYLRARL